MSSCRATNAEPFRTYTVERCRFTTVASLRRHYADRDGAENIAGGVRYTARIGAGSDGLITTELTLAGGAQ